jgi:Skp family chaperone for outer membrane proteins
MMKMLALAAVVIAGCSTAGTMTTNSDSRLADMERANQKIDKGEQQCIDDVRIRIDDELARIAGTLQASTDRRIQKLADERERTILECQDRADQLREKLTSDERAEYQAREHEERDRNSLMAILTVSGPR